MSVLMLYQQLSNCDRDHVAHKAQICYQILCRKVCVFNETTVLLVTDSSGVVCLALEGWEPLS